MTKKTLVSTIASDKVCSLSDSAINALYRLAAAVLIARMAGAEALACYVLMATAQISLSSIAAAASETPMLNHASRLGPERRREVLAWSAHRSRRIRLGTGAAGIAISPLAIRLGLDPWIYAGFVLSTLFYLSAQFERARLQALFATKQALPADCIAIACSLCACIIAPDPALGLWWGSACGLALATEFMKGRYKPGAAPAAQSDAARALRRSSAPTLAGCLANTACSRLHPYIIQFAGSAAAVASYGAASSLLGPMRFASVALSNLLRPRLAAAGGGSDKAERLAQQSKILIVSMGTAATALMIAAGPQLAQVVFGSDIQLTGALLALAAAYGSVDALSTLQMIRLQTAQLESGASLAFRFRLLAAGISLGLALPCLHLFGLKGAFVSLIAAECAYVHAASRHLKTKRMARARKPKHVPCPEISAQLAN